MKRITIGRKKVAAQEGVLGGTETYIKEIPISDLESYEFKLDTKGYKPLADLIKVSQSETGELKVSIQLEDLDASLRKVQPTPKTGNESQQREKSAGLPPVPEAEIGSLKNKTRKRFYKRLQDNPDSQPAQIREIIFRKSPIKRGELLKLLKSKGYSPETSGSVGASLKVLEDVTKEIHRKGRGDKEEIKWIGPNQK